MISYLVLMAIVVCFSAILALALNFQWGLGGMVNFGLAGLYALGAYSCALLMLKGGANTFFATLGAMAIVAAACGIVALVTLRVTEEDYFAIVTLGAGEMLRLVVLNEDWLTKGALGLTGMPRPLGDVIASEYYQYFLLGLAVVLLLGTVWFLNVIARSPFGRIVRALREDDVVAATLGKHVLWARVRIFAIGGAFIGLAGSLHALLLPVHRPDAVLQHRDRLRVHGGDRGRARRALRRDLGRCRCDGAARRLALPQGPDPGARFRPARRHPHHHHRRRPDPAADLSAAGVRCANIACRCEIK